MVAEAISWSPGDRFLRSEHQGDGAHDKRPLADDNVLCHCQFGLDEGGALPIDDGAETPYQSALYIGLQHSSIQRDRQVRILQSPWVKGEQMTTESMGIDRSANRDGRTGAPTELASRADGRRDARRGAASE
ncbi:hypothetical protein Landi51_06316 [Colletotrichum acutatum]